MRLFVALDIPDAVRTRLADVVRDLRSTGADAGWVRLGGAHVTLKFIGEVPEAKCESIRAALESVSAAGAIDIRFRGLGFFPSSRQPRVLWAGIEAGPQLAALASVIEQRLEPLGIERENRDFHPHLTLAKLKSAKGLDQLRAAAARFSESEFGGTTACEFYIYQSVLKRTGAEYTRLATYPLTRE